MAIGTKTERKREVPMGMGDGDEMEYGDEDTGDEDGGDTVEELMDVDDASCHRLRQLLFFHAICRLRNCSL